MRMPPSELPPVTLHSDNPLHVLSQCQRVAARAGWSLAQWMEFSESFRSCFSADALPEEAEAAMRIVESHFTVRPKASLPPDATQ